MYAKIENGVAVEYPLYEGDLERRFPELVFPLDAHLEENNGVICPEGYARVLPVEQPNDHTKNFQLGMPELDPIDNIWKETWISVSATEEQINTRIQIIKSRVRDIRNNKLLSSDVFMIIDRWETYSEEEKSSWKIYRQELRDLPKQEGFPFDVIWPTPPVEIPNISQFNPNRFLV